MEKTMTYAEMSKEIVRLVKICLPTAVSPESQWRNANNWNVRVGSGVEIREARLNTIAYLGDLIKQSEQISDSAKDFSVDETQLKWEACRLEAKGAITCIESTMTDPNPTVMMDFKTHQILIYDKHIEVWYDLDAHIEDSIWFGVNQILSFLKKTMAFKAFRASPNGVFPTKMAAVYNAMDWNERHNCSVCHGILTNEIVDAVQSSDEFTETLVSIMNSSRQKNVPVFVMVDPKDSRFTPATIRDHMTRNRRIPSVESPDTSFDGMEQAFLNFYYRTNYESPKTFYVYKINTTKYQNIIIVMNQRSPSLIQDMKAAGDIVAKYRDMLDSGKIGLNDNAMSFIIE